MLSITEWAEFWSGDSAASMATCYRALECAITDAQRLHTLLSLLSAALDMRRWDAVAVGIRQSRRASCHARGPKKPPERKPCALMLPSTKATCVAARELIQDCHDQRQTVAQRAASLNTHGMIDMALGDYDSAAASSRGGGDRCRWLRSRADVAHIEDNIAFLQASMGQFERRAASTARLREHSDALDPTMLCFVPDASGDRPAAVRRPRRSAGPDAARDRDRVARNATPTSPTMHEPISRWRRGLLGDRAARRSASAVALMQRPPVCDSLS